MDDFSLSNVFNKTECSWSFLDITYLFKNEDLSMNNSNVLAIIEGFCVYQMIVQSLRNHNLLISMPPLLTIRIII